MRIAILLLAIWLIIWGILAITNVRFEGQNLIMGCLAIAAGAMLLWERYSDPRTVA